MTKFSQDCDLHWGLPGAYLNEECPYCEQSLEEPKEYDLYETPTNPMGWWFI